MRNGFTIIELMIVVMIIGVLAAIAIPNYISMQNRAKETGVRGAAHTVQLAAEDFAVRNDGVYSDAAADIVPLLPAGVLIENVYTGGLTEPRFAGPAAAAGQIGLQVLALGGANVGYTITAMGKDPADGLLLTIISGQ